MATSSSLGSSYLSGVDPRDENGKPVKRDLGGQVIGALTGIDAFSDINGMRNPAQSTFQSQIYDPSASAYNIDDNTKAQRQEALVRALNQKAPTTKSAIVGDTQNIKAPSNVKSTKVNPEVMGYAQMTGPSDVGVSKNSGVTGEAKYAQETPGATASSMRSARGRAATGVASQQYDTASVDSAQRGYAKADAAQMGSASMQAARVNQGASNQLRGGQVELADALRARASGQSSSSAELQLEQGLSKAIAAQRAQQATARGVSAGLANRQASQGIVSAQSQANAQAAQLRAQEQAQAEQSLSGVLQGAREQDIGLASQQAQLQQQAAQTNVANAQQTLGQNAANQQQVNLANAGYTQEALGQNAQLSQQAAIQSGQWQQETAARNAELSQQTSLANLGNQQSMSLANLQNQQQASQFNASNQQQTSLQNAQLAQQAAQFNATQGQGMELANIANMQQANLQGQQLGLQASLANQQTAYNTAQQNAGLVQQAYQTNAVNRQQTSQNYAAQTLQAALANQQVGYNVNATNAATANQVALQNASFKQQAALANQQATLQNNAQVNQSVQTYIGMGMSQDQAQAQAYQDYYQLMAQQTQAANAVNAQTAQQNVDSQNKSNTGLIGAAGSIIGGIFSDERAKKDIEPTKERDLKEFLEAASKAREQEEEARNQAALRTVPLDARIASRMTPKQAERFKGFATLFASARDGMEAPASDQAQVSEQAPQRSGASNKNIEDERIRRLLEAYTSSPSIYQRTPDTDASYARLPKDWSPPPGATGFPVGFDRSKLKPGDLENPPSWPSARADTGEMLDSVNPVDFRYRDKSMGDGQQYGVIAQDLERSKIGRSLVRTDPATGYKAIDTDRGFGAVLAAQSELNKRIAALEEKKRRAA